MVISLMMLCSSVQVGNKKRKRMKKEEPLGLSRGSFCIWYEIIYKEADKYR